MRMFENDESKVYDAAMILRLHEIMECNLFTMPHILTAVELNRCGSYCELDHIFSYGCYSVP